MITPVMQHKPQRPGIAKLMRDYGGEPITIKSERVGNTPRQRKMTEPEHKVWFRGECVGEVYRGSRGWVYQHAGVALLDRIQWRYEGYDTRAEAAWHLVAAIMDPRKRRSVR